MNFSKFDMVILIVMSIAIVVMSFVFPALGLADAETSESDIPSFDMQADRFDFAGDFPDRPGTPSSGTLDFNTTEPAQFSDNQRWLNGDTSNGTELVMIQPQPATSPETARVTLRGWDGGAEVNQDNATFNATGEQAVLTANNYEVALEMVTHESLGNDEYNFEVDYQIRDQPTTGGGWLGRVPVVGTIFESADSLAGVLSWLGSVIWWLFTSFWELVLNALGLVFDIVSFLVGTVSWLVVTYGTILSAAESWVAVFIAIPGLLLSLIWVKLAMIFVSLLPTT